MNAAVPSTNTPPLLELRGIRRSYRNGELETEVLHGIDLTIHAGEFVAIIGASGSGKSTLMHILGCLDRPSAGQYLFRGQDVATLQPDELARLRREELGFVFQSYHLLGTATAVENVEIPAVYRSVPAALRRARALQLLAALGLGQRSGHKPGQLSGGQQQRVSIARALMNGGSIILADEPTGALDSTSGAEVMRLLVQLSQQGHTIILITHAMEVARHARRQIEIRDGNIVADPGPQAVPSPTALPATALATGKASLGSDLLQAMITAMRALRANLFRTALTLLGIVIGVASVITMLAIGDGARQEVVDQISSMGSNLLLVRPGQANQRGRGGVATLTVDDVRAINSLPNIQAAIPELSGSTTLRFGNADRSTETNATSADFPLARRWPVAEGSFFSAEDEATYAAVAVLGQTVASSLFPDGRALGRHVMINNMLFQVIGVMSNKGASPMGQDQDDVVFVPYSTGSLRLFGQRWLRNITIAVDDVSQMDATQDAVHSLLLQRHGGTEDFQIRNMASLLDSITETQNTLTVLLGSIAAISLLVGGIGVMNIMLVNVSERTREIGIRMATGARSGHILQQFLIEAMVVSAIGGLIGIAAGLGSGLVVEAFGKPVQFSLGPVLLAFGCAFATGLIFGFLPARAASRLDPVVALAAE